MKRLFASNVRAFLALGTLIALVAVATLRPLPNVWGQDKETPTRKVEKKAEEKAEEKTEEPAPVKEGEVKKAGRGEKTEKEPVKGEEKVPMKEKRKLPEGRPVPRKGDPEIPGRKGDPEISKDPVPGRVRPVPGKEKPKGGGTQLAKDAFEYDARSSTTCGKGKICFNFKLPKIKDEKGNIITATGMIGVTLCQNGQPIMTLESPQLNEKTGGQYCFAIDPDKMRDLDPALGGFDFMASVMFTFNMEGTAPTSATVGARPEGINRGLNNDYQFVCKEVPKVTPKEVEKVVIEGLPEDFDDQQRLAYRRLEHQDLPFEEYLRFAKLEFGRLRQLEKNPALRYQPSRRGRSTPNTACGNGDFEPPVNPANAVNSAEWDGGYGSMLPGNGNPNTSLFTMGLFPGPITAPNAHQTVVSAGIDPNVPIQMTGPDTSIPSTVSPNAVRIGNAVNGYGAELLSKTFTVTPSDTLIRFWYAVVLQNPVGHAVSTQPAFQVRVIDNSTTLEVPNLVSLGNTPPSNKLIADVNNPFFQNKVVNGETIVYRDWQCAQINLSTLVGQSVTIQFMTQDCAWGGHWGYAYVDDICGTCVGNPGGDIAFDPKTSTQCGKGQVCFKYTLPHTQNAAGNVTGTAVITLDIYQTVNGIPNLLQTLTSPTLSTDGIYCFPIDPLTIPGLNPALGFDLVADGIFTLGTQVTPLSVGTAPDGRIPGLNNDYNDPRICNEKPKECGCCPGENLVKDGDFEQGLDIHSEYEWTSEYNKLFPGTYSVGHVDKIEKFCSNWKLPKACDGTKNFYENVLIVNGQTNQPAGSTAVIWSQQIVLPSDAGLKGADYRLCFRYLPLPQCCFDIQAKPYILVNDGRIPLTDVCDEDTGCGHLYAATFHGAGTVNVQIVLPEDGKGDGNDLLIDNISMVKIVPVPFAVVDFTLFAGPLNGGTKDVTLTATSSSLTSPTYTWWWEMWDNTDPNNPVLLQTVLGNPGNVTTVTFPGLMPLPKTYLFKLKAESECQSRAGMMQDWDFGPTPAARSAQGKSVVDPNPEPLNRKTIKAGNPEAVKREKGPLPTKRSE